MTAIEQLRDEIANLHLLADRLARASVEHPTFDECWTEFERAANLELKDPRVSRRAADREGIVAVRALCLASRSPSHELVEAADALRNEMTMPSDGSFAPFVDRSLKDKIEAYDAARSRHASGAQPDSACDESGWLVEITGPKYWTGTPGCGNWTADSRAAMRFARRQDAEAACRHIAPSGAIPVEHAWVSHRPAGAQPSGAPAPAPAPALASVEAEFVEVADCLRDRFDLLYRMNGTWNPRDAKETAHDEECLLEYDRVREEIGAYMEPASAQGEVCEKCSGAGWVWGHELPTPEEKPTDTRYSCPACRVTNIDGTPPSSEKTGDGMSASGSTGARTSVACDPSLPTHAPSPASPVKPCPDVPFGSLGNDVEETLDALLGFGRSARMVERAQLRNEIAGLLARRTPAPSPATGESAPMPTREREEILKNDEIALAIADGMARCADVFCDQAQPDRRREAARMTHKRLADSRELLADLRAEAVAAWDAAEAAEERCSYKACGCMYDRKDDVCSVHSPAVEKLRAEVDRLRTALAEKEKAGVDVRKLLVDAGFCDEFGTPDPLAVERMRAALRTALGAKETK